MDEIEGRVGRHGGRGRGCRANGSGTSQVNEHEARPIPRRRRWRKRMMMNNHKRRRR